MIKKILLTILVISLFWAIAGDALAAIQLDPTLKPENLPDFTAAEAISEDNPETAATQTLILFVGNIVSQVLLFAGAVSIIFLIVSGAQYILAFGKDEKIEKGKRGIFWSTMGLLVILFSYAIVQGIISILLQVDVSAT